jgi:hypothetical protein
MEQLRDFLEAVRRGGLASGHFRGLLHVLIGRRIQKVDGAEVSSGLNWREAAALLKLLRWEPDAVKELGLDPATLPPRDRQRFWYSVITQANVGAPEAAVAANRLAGPLRSLGYVIGPAPGAGSSRKE